MSIRDFVMIAAGEVLLAFTFGLGLIVGATMKRKEPKDGYDS